ncbi:AFR745Wp [Eremothecium gossypii ATCC 10895]|uniref:AFR745Wp n=1 Tax=Eremothecium gossypii (strain ATCC 10895 / CBS 109.51 / FGSC 9923 / NRRL Y-1056) TaxID=284811 RepID=Q751S9_EREGS|nr:AFR745Wp [Eremothecium gossypii ATCC 10895]AAS54118.1 AFR745Wp [Eremothecium gossypii ATCC 10895]AEY98434.1 FAFR745Wp [Eremothecium gossypii FDAG1]
MELLDGLCVSARKKTTYKKVRLGIAEQSKDEPSSNKPAAVFRSSLLDRVRTRLNVEDGHAPSSDALEPESGLTDDVYDGENLEVSFDVGDAEDDCLPTQADGKPEQIEVNVGTAPEEPFSRIKIPLKLSDGGIFSPSTQVDDEMAMQLQPTQKLPPESPALQAVDTHTELQDELETGVAVDGRISLSQTQVIVSGTNYGPTRVDDEVVATQQDSMGTADAQCWDTQTLDCALADDFQATIPDAQTLATARHEKLFIHQIEEEIATKTQKELPMMTQAKEAPYIPKQKLVFTKDNFLDSFDDDSETEIHGGLDGSDRQVSYNDREHTETGPQSSQPATGEGQDTQVLYPALQSLSITSKSYQEARQIILDESSEDDTDVNLSSAVSKAAVLAIKARNSKFITPQKIDETKSSKSNELFAKLRKANREQLLEQRRNAIERRGINMQNLEQEREQLGNLLEQELERNRRIRIREKKIERERLENENVELTISSDDASSDEDVPESDAGSIADPGASSTEDEDSGLSSEIDSDMGEESDHSVVTKRRSRRILVQSDDEGTETTENRQAIHLGVYGNNIKPQDTGPEARGSYLTSRIKKYDDLSPVKTTTSTPKGLTDGRAELDHESPDGHSLNTNLQQGLSKSESSSTKVSEDELDQETRRKILSDLLARNRKRAERNKLRRREMKKKGITKMLEMEAEESEDEWHGIGGSDNELSEDYDSEVEKMIDDYSVHSSNADHLRAILAKNERQHDENIVNKILHDISTGGFRRRGKGALDLEMSENEDQELQQFRQKRRELLKQKILENGDTSKLVSNPKSYAFFQTMVDDVTEASFGNTFDANIDEKTDPSAAGRKIVISEQFVKETLSFLSSKSGDSEIPAETKSISSSTVEREEIQDLHTLKQNSNIKHLKGSLELPAQMAELSSGDEGDYGFSLDRFRSAAKSFNNGTNVDDKFKSGTKAVRILKANKTIGGSKAAITFIGRKRRLIPPKNDYKDSEPKLNSSKRARSQLFSEGNNRSFDT